MPRPEQFPVKKLLRLDDAMVERIDQWRRAQKPIPTESEAIRQLLDAGLVAEGIA